MIGTVEFNASTLFRYATVDVDALQKNLGDAEATRRAVEAFIHAFTTSMPSGKQNTFANRTLPDAVVIAVRDSQPVNPVGAFEEAIIGEKRLEQASDRLAKHLSDIDEQFGTTPFASWVVRVGDATQPLDRLSGAERVALSAGVSAVGDTVASRLSASS